MPDPRTSYGFSLCEPSAWAQAQPKNLWVSPAKARVEEVTVKIALYIEEELVKRATEDSSHAYSPGFS